MPLNQLLPWSVARLPWATRNRPSRVSQAGRGQRTAGLRQRAGHQSLPASLSGLAFPQRTHSKEERQAVTTAAPVARLQLRALPEIQPLLWINFQAYSSDVAQLLQNPIDWIGRTQGCNLKCATRSNVGDLWLTKVEEISEHFPRPLFSHEEIEAPKRLLNCLDGNTPGVEPNSCHS